MWREADLRWLTNQDLFDHARDITEHTGQFRADVARYEILHRYGGVYVDCDMRCQKPIDELCDVPVWAAWEKDGWWVNNAIMGARPGHPLFAELIEALPANVAANVGSRPNVLSGPQFVTPIVAKHDVVIHPSAMFYPYRWDELERDGEEFPDAYAVHHWENRRKMRGVPRG